jgi:RNA polymerase sigma-70 factor (ECF subfamily)
MSSTSPELVKLLSVNAEEALRQMYDQYYSYLCYAVYNVLPDRAIAEDIVQEVFFEIWKKRERLNINSSLRSYLKRAAINKTLNYIRDLKLKFEDEEKATMVVDKNVEVQRELEAQELQLKIDNAINGLPEKCRIIFGMSRYEEMTYKEIAQQLEISVKTVENQISKALRLMRIALDNYL